MSDEGQTHATCHEMVVIIRPSLKKICDQDACRAALFNHLLYWIAQKAKGQPAEKIKSGNVYWWGSYDDICSTGLADSWTMWKVRKEIPLLVASGIMGQRHNPTKGFDRTFQYFFGLDQGKALKALCEKHGVNLLEIGLQADVIHLLETTNACAVSNKCKCSNQQMHVLKTTNASAGFSRAIPKVSYKGFTKETESSPRSKIIPVTVPLSLSEEEKDSSEEESNQKDKKKALEDRLAALKNMKGVTHA